MSSSLCRARGSDPSKNGSQEAADEALDLVQRGYDTRVGEDGGGSKSPETEVLDTDPALCLLCRRDVGVHVVQICIHTVTYHKRVADVGATDTGAETWQEQCQFVLDFAAELYAQYGLNSAF